MKAFRKRTGSSNLREHIRISRIPRIINTAISIVLFGIGTYHFTQPAGAWRSGTAEYLCAISLLTSAYLVSRIKAIMINLIIAGVMIGLGIRHLIHGGGWRSGSIELFFAALLIISAILIYREKRE